MEESRGDRSGCGRIGCWIFAVVFALFLTAVLWPCHYPRTAARKANCQSNMKQMGAAFKMYLQDWHDTYPTNRSVLANAKVGPISSYVKLTPAIDLLPPGRPRNLSWVEALYPYMEPPSDVGGNKVECGAWECTSASTQRYPRGSKTAYTTYVMNRNLVERPEGCLTAADRTMLAREADRHLNAELRPTNYSCGRHDVPPDSPFLTSLDSRLGRTEPKLHAQGSHILFADSHVRFFPEYITRDKCWDAGDRQWYSYNDRGYPAQRKTIAITP